MKVRFDQIARECRNTHNGSMMDIPIVGLEHIEPYDMLLKNSDINVETTFSKTFKKGQILFGRRRAYQHKACVATFDGICSGDITVIEAIEGAIYPDLLPFIVQNDDFFEHAIKGSNGALSPRVKWEHMANFEVNLPTIDEQKVLAEKLWAAYEVKQSYLKMIDATDEMVKAQFIEMFGNPQTNSQGRKSVRFDEVLTFQRGHDLPEKERKSEGVIPIYGSNGFVGYHTESKAKDGIVTGRSGSIGKVYSIKGDYWPLNTSLYSIDTHGNNLTYLKYMVEAFDVSRFSNGTGVPTLNRNDIHKEMIPLADIAEQRTFETIAYQADKSISELRKSIDAIDKVIKSLINENL